MLASPTKRSLAMGWLYFVISAAAVAALLQFAIEAPWFGLCLGLAVAAIATPRLRARRRFRDLVLSGDVNTLLSAWEPDLGDEEEARTVGPLMRATALAAHGLSGRARQVLDLARRGPAWDEAVEHRLFLDTLLACCEGRTEEALRSAEAMQELPLPTSRWERGRATTLRSATSAMARAFGGLSSRGDTKWLRLAARQNPLLVWPMRYAEALTQVRLGEHDKARGLLRIAPSWPRESAFRSFTHQLETSLDSATAID